MTRFERASQIWAVLAWAACHRQSLTYGQLGRVTGCFQGGLGALLEPIQSFCLVHRLPPLTVIVVQQDTGLPGTGFTGASDLALAQAQVFAFNWLEQGNPGSEKLEAATKALPSNGTLTTVEAT